MAKRRRAARHRSRARPDARLLPPAAVTVPDTPLAPNELAAEARELRALLGELSNLTGAGDAWSLRILRRNVEIAWLCPETLENRQNQLDFVEELAEAVWDGADPGFRHPLWTSGADLEETTAREQRRQVVLERLDQVAERLCREVERWQRLAAAARRDGEESPANPQVEHRL